MRSQKIFQGIAMSAAAGAAALTLAACGSSQPQAETTTTAPGTSPAGPTASPAPPATSAAPSATAPSTSAAPAAPGLCKAAGLSAATDATGGGAAGSVYMTLSLTNTGTEPCILKGFPGVSLVANNAGAPIGAPATRDGSAPVTEVLLAPGQAGSAVLRYTQAGNYMDCGMVDAAGYRIYPPEDTASLFLPQPTKACTNAAVTLLSIGTFQPS
ncbi:DUF4232 domain-containing protein [Arthrobacter sp. MPF02]|uniref:DUF4232 domain-containing protein n=1 Tax=Arthrobacter sp. MPF02 TaxID=3388492 RepID=UPI003985613C